MLRVSLCPTVVSTTLKLVLLRRYYFSFIFRHAGAKTISLRPVVALSCGSPTCFPTVHNVSEKLSNRETDLPRSRFSHVLGVLRSSSLIGSGMRDVMGLHCVGFKLGMLSHLPISTLLMKLYSRAGNLVSALAVFQEVRNKDVVSRNAVLTALVENHEFESAFEFFYDLIGIGREYDSTTLLLVVSALSHMDSFNQGKMVHGLGIKSGMIAVSGFYNALLNMYAKCGDLNSAQVLFEIVENRDCVSWNTIITGYLANDCHRMCMLYFKQMISKNEVVDDVTLSCAIAASTSMEELNMCKTLHGLTIKLGHEHGVGVSVANSLISMYSSFRDVEAAETVFSEMVKRDNVSWNAMIDGLATDGMIRKALSIFSGMHIAESVQPDVTTVVTLIPLCTDFMLLREGKSFHGYAIRRGMETKDATVLNSLIDMYSKCNNIQKAELVFATMSEQDLISWNTMISAYAQNGFNRETQALFKKMLCSYSEFSVATVLAVLPSCDSIETLHFGKSIHSWVIKLGFEDNVLVANSLLNMYQNCEDLATAFLLLQEMSAIRDTASWNTIINGCIMNDQCLEALRAFILMRYESKVLLNSITFVAVISACGYLEYLLSGKSMHSLATKLLPIMDTRVQNALLTMYGRCSDMESAVKVYGSISHRNLCSSNCMISAFSQNGAGREAIQLFREIEFEPDEITLVSLLPSCSQLGLINNGKQIHCYINRHGFHKSPYVSAALTGMYSNLGRLDIALNVFRLAQSCGSIITWNSMISSYGCHGRGREAIQLFDEMCINGIKPNRGTFTSLLSACSHAGLVEEGLWYYQRMLKTYGVEPITEHQVCVVDMLGRSAKLQEACEFIEGLPEMPEPGVWGALLSACRYNEGVDMGTLVAQLLFRLEPDNTGYYVSLSNMYLAAGRRTEAAAVRAIVHHRRLKKPPGYSLVDVESAGISSG